MEKIKQLEDFFIQQMRNRIDAVDQQVKFFDKTAKNIVSNKIKQILIKNADLKRKHLKCFKQIFKILEIKSKSEVCEGTKAQIYQTTELLSKSESDKLMDIALLISVEQSNYHNIAGYQTCKTFAKQLGHEEIAEVLEEMISEQKEIIEKISSLTKFVLSESEVKTTEEI